MYSSTPVSVYDIHDILSNLPSLQRLELSLDVVTEIRSLELTPPKRYSLQTLSLSFFGCPPDLYPCYLAGLLHLFDEIDELILVHRIFYDNQDAISADPMATTLIKHPPSFPPDLRVHSLFTGLPGFEPVHDKIVTSPICASVTNLRWSVDESNVLTKIQGFFNACRNLKSLYLEFWCLDAHLLNPGEELTP